MVKLLMSWDIIQGRESEYFEFVVKEWAPGLQKMGIETHEVWFTVYGDCPQILASGLARDVATVRGALASPDWQRLEGRLKEFVTDFEHKVIPATGGFQL
ncbi:MAG TPA: hypothetical protein VJG32_23055 [Anaerolineae bacterium]|nr:hypothetical protein [Anaerolineae bacterium]